MIFLYLFLANMCFVGSGYCFVLATGGFGIFLIPTLILLALAGFFYYQMTECWRNS